ncbi:hypothetical protein D3C81_1963240 [compost metagenome]
MFAGLGQGAIAPVHGNRGRRIAGHQVARPGDAVGIGHIRLDIQHRRAIEQIDAGQQQPPRLHTLQANY